MNQRNKAEMATSSAAIVAKKGMGMLLSATKSGLSAIQSGIQKARKGYASKHEQDVLNELRSKGMSCTDHVYEALRRFYHLNMAGYTHEIAAAAQLCSKRLTDTEKSSVPLNVVLVLGGVLCEEALKYGDFQKGRFAQGMQDFLNKSRMGKDHYDRDSIAHDVYYATLLVAEEFEDEWDSMQEIFRVACSKLVEVAAQTDPSPDARIRAAKSAYMVASAIKIAGQEGEAKKQKALQDAQAVIRKEQDRSRGPAMMLSSVSMTANPA